MTRDLRPSAPTETDIAEIVTTNLDLVPTNLRALRGGAWSHAFAFDTARGSMVLRVSATADDFRADQNASALKSPFLPIPRVLCMGEWNSAWWCISELMPGGHLDDLTADQLQATVPSLLETLQAMRNVDSSRTHGYGGWDDKGNGLYASFADQLMDVAVDRTDERGGGWRSRLEQHPAELAVFDQGLSEMERLCPYIPAVRQLIHQDMLNYNVTVQNNRISGIFDWGCAMWGDALYEIAWFQFWWPWYPQWHNTSLQTALAKLASTYGDNYQERLQAYLLHIGIMHIRYNALIENWQSMRDVSRVTAAILGST